LQRNKEVKEMKFGRDHVKDRAPFVYKQRKDLMHIRVKRLTFFFVTFLVLFFHMNAGAAVTVDYSNVTGSSPAEYGTNGFATDGDEAMWISRWNEAGIKVIRVQLPQYFIEPVNDNADPHTTTLSNFLFETAIPVPPDYNKTITLATTFTAMKDAGVTIQLNPVYLSPWLTSNTVPPPFQGFPGDAYCSYPPNDLDEYEEYIYAVLYYLVNVIDYPPDRIMLDVINEPDLGCGADPVVPCFWYNHSMNDVAQVVYRSYDAIQAVDSRIRMVGLAECCDSFYTTNFMNNYDGADYLSGLTYHRYVSADFSSGISRGNTLKSYGLPVYCNEYGSSTYLSDGIPGAIWHAYALPLMWQNGISPLQFPFSELAYSMDPYNSMGLMYDWTATVPWERKPAYWVYANFCGNFGGKDLVSITADSGLNVLAGKTQSGMSTELALWISNSSVTSFTDLGFTIQNYSATDAQVQVLDNLTGTSYVDSFPISGDPLTFTYSIPSGASYTFRITSGTAGIPAMNHRAMVAFFAFLVAAALWVMRQRPKRAI